MAQNDKQAIFVDAVVFESCNLACDYCRKEVMVLKEEMDAVAGTVRSLLGLSTLANYNILKISGYGEITLTPKLEEILKMAEEKRVLLITNGTLLDERLLDLLMNHPDPVLCVSLDGHTSEMNAYRKLSDRALSKIFHNISIADKMGIPIEINSVLSNSNISQFRFFLDYIMSMDLSAMVFPFPPRSFASMKQGSYFPSPDQIANFEQEVVNHYQDYERALPPIAYLERMLKFMSDGLRSFPCYQPSIVIGINRELDIMGCPCGPTEILGNLQTMDSESLKEKMVGNAKGKWKECRGCFNHYEALSMYLSGDISDEEVTRIPSVSSPKIYSHLKMIREALNNG